MQALSFDFFHPRCLLLLTDAAPDMVVLDVYRNICLKHNVSFQADGTLLSIDDFAIDHPDSCQERVRNFYSSHMKMSRELQDFDFTIEEETLLRAIFIMSPGLFSVFCLKLYAAISFGWCKNFFSTWIPISAVSL